MMPFVFAMVACVEDDLRIEQYQAAITITWESDQTISRTYVVPAGSALVVRPGTTVGFDAGAKLIVEGALIATGVTFTASGPDGWSGIEVRGAGSSLYLNDATIERAVLALSITGSAAENTKQILGSRLWNSVTCSDGVCPPFIQAVDTSKVVIADNQIGTGLGWDGTYGITFTRVDDSIISGNLINPVGRDGIVLGGKDYVGSSGNQVTGNTVRGSNWQCYYLNSRAHNNLFEDDIADGCGSAVDVWSAPGNRFVRLTIKNIPAGGFGIAPIGALVEDDQAPAATTFEHLVFRGWGSGAQLIDVGDNGLPFDLTQSHTIIFNDVVFANAETGTAAIYNRDGDFRFHGLGTEDRRSTAALTFAVADVDGDGNDDILSPSNDVPHTMDILYNLGAAGFRRTGARWEIPWTFISSLRFSDFTGDGKADVLALLGDAHQAQVAQSSGSAGFANLGVWELPWTSDANMRFADFTGDGKADVLALLGDRFRAQVAQSGGSGGFANVGIWELPWTGDENMRFADFTGDGKADVLAYADGGVAQIARSAGNSGFANVGLWTLPSTNFGAMRFFDEDHDGYADLVLQVDGGFRIYRNLGGTGFDSAYTFYAIN